MEGDLNNSDLFTVAPVKSALKNNVLETRIMGKSMNLSDFDRSQI